MDRFEYFTSKMLFFTLSSFISIQFIFQSRIEVNKFLSDEQPFEMFKIKVAYYHNLSIEIALTSSRVITIGVFEIHREHFISILINKSQATKDRFLNKINDTYQNSCRW